MKGRLTLLGTGAMLSPRYAPAGLLVSYGQTRVMLDGGPGAEPGPPLVAWLVCDLESELRTQITRLAASFGLTPRIAAFRHGQLVIEPHPVKHTSHQTVGYLITTPDWRAIWVPEFFRFPAWARDADIMFAEASGWKRPIRFAGGVGGHAAACDVARAARRAGVKRLVFAHIGRPTIRALDTGETPPFGEVGVEGMTY
jgi:hypothetical protein